LGILAGIALAAFVVPKNASQSWLLPATLLTGIAMGLAFPLVPMIKNRWTRFGLGLGLAMVPVAVILIWNEIDSNFLPNSAAAGVFLLLGLPFFYLLTLGGRAEETEVEIGVICATMALALWLWSPVPFMRSLAFALPALLYWRYTDYYLPKV